MLQVHAACCQVRLSMIPPDEKEVERIAYWVAKQIILFKALLELGIFGTIVANHSRVGLGLCILYTPFSSILVYVEDVTAWFWKEKQ